MSSVNQYKEAGNVAFAQKDYIKAIECYNLAIELDPNNHFLFRYY